MNTNFASQAATSPGVVAPLPPPAARRGWQIAPPDFVGVGTMRSGTTWWWSLLAAHPAVVEPDHRHKEVHFFDHYMGVAEFDPTSYHRYFPRPPGTTCGEWTPRYMYDFWTPPMLRYAAPDARILVLLRDPLDRYLSGLSLNQSRGYHLTQSLLHQQFERSLYGSQLRGLLSYFPRGQVLVLQYEQCIADPLGQVRRTLEFIGLDAGDWRAHSMIERRVSLSTKAKPQLDPATLEALATGLRADLPDLFALAPELDPQLWPTASGHTELAAPAFAGRTA